MRPRVMVLACLWLWPGLAAAQLPPAAAYVDRPVVSVAIDVEGRISTEPGLMEAVQTRTGAPLTMADVRETITHLYNLGRFEDVRVEAEAAPNGVALRYVLSPIHTVTRILFKGQLGLSEGMLRGRMVERFGETPPLARAADVSGNTSVPIEELRPLLKTSQGDVFVASKLGAIAGAISQLYKTKGFASVQVDSAVNEVTTGLVRPAAVIKEGPRVLVGGVTLSGNAAIPSERLTPLL
ncbi:MAG TPA: POTRA domain-containing protein, partial [Vicinamibacterales bacterium]